MALGLPAGAMDGAPPGAIMGPMPGAISGVAGGKPRTAPAPATSGEGDGDGDSLGGLGGGLGEESLPGLGEGDELSGLGLGEESLLGLGEGRLSVPGLGLGDESLPGLGDESVPGLGDALPSPGGGDTGLPFASTPVKPLIPGMFGTSDPGGTGLMPRASATAAGSAGGEGGPCISRRAACTPRSHVSRRCVV